MTTAFDGVAAEQPAEDGELRVQGVRRVGRQVLLPDVVDQPLRGDRLGEPRASSATIALSFGPAIGTAASDDRTSTSPSSPTSNRPATAAPY